MTIQNVAHKIPGEVLQAPLLPVAFLGGCVGASIGWTLGDQLEAAVSSSQAGPGEPSGSKTKSCFVAKISSFILALAGMNGTGYWLLKTISPHLSSKQTKDAKDLFYIITNVSLFLATACLLLMEKAVDEQKNGGGAGDRESLAKEGRINLTPYLLKGSKSRSSG